MLALIAPFWTGNMFVASIPFLAVALLTAPARMNSIALEITIAVVSSLYIL